MIVQSLILGRVFYNWNLTFRAAFYLNFQGGSIIGEGPSIVASMVHPSSFTKLTFQRWPILERQCVVLHGYLPLDSTPWHAEVFSYKHLPHSWWLQKRQKTIMILDILYDRFSLFCEDWNELRMTSNIWSSQKNKSCHLKKKFIIEF